MDRDKNVRWRLPCRWEKQQDEQHPTSSTLPMPSWEDNLFATVKLGSPCTNQLPHLKKTIFLKELAGVLENRP